MVTTTNADHDDGNTQDESGDSRTTASLVKRFDDICFSIGDCDAIELLPSDEEDAGSSPSSVCYFELQEHSKTLAAQLFHRYRPDYVLIDCKGWVVPEAVATLACMRLQIPFVPVSCYDQHRPGKLEQVVELLQKQKSRHTKTSDQCSRLSSTTPSVVVAVTVCANDRDPVLSVFQQAGVHQVLYLDDKTGSLNEQLNVPDQLPLVEVSTKAVKNQDFDYRDDLYVLFTSGTSTNIPKAVVGSHHATFHRIQWFLDYVGKQNSDKGSFGMGIGSNRIGRRSKLTFVDGVNELWSGLLDQASLLVSVPPQRLQAHGIACLYNKCSHLLLLPSQLQQMLLLPKSDMLKRVLVSGEVCSTFVVHDFYSKYDFETECKLYNLFGQTESTGDVCFALLYPPEENNTTVVRGCVTIGKPILDSIQIKLRKVDTDDVSNDESMQEAQELILLGADQLANGYLTENGEIREPFSDFATGDIGFFHNDQFYIQGRKNDIIKINGIWTSPTEIEASFATVYELLEGTTVVAVILPNESTADHVCQQQQHKSYVLCTQPSVHEEFSRLEMHQNHQVPWNLIPNDVFLVESIPRSTGGAGKLNRRSCKDLVVELLAKQHHLDSSEGIDAKEATLFSLIASVLSVPLESVDKSNSFVEMGGNSASSITLLYLIRQKLNLDSQVAANLTVLDILNASSLDHLGAQLTGAEEPPLKRPKVGASSRDSIYEEPKLVSRSDCHEYISMMACADAAPLLVMEDEEKFIFVGCQGGMILKVNANNRAIVAHKYLQGWMVQAEMIYLESSNRIVVVAHTIEGKGMVLVLSSSLETAYWEQVVDEPIKTSPVLLENRLIVLAGSTVLAFDVSLGTKINDLRINLPHPCSTRPLVITGKGGTSLLAYASSDWEACMMMVDPQAGSVTKILEYEIGPVHKDMVLVDDDKATCWISGSYGIAYRVDLDKSEVLWTHQPSSSPLSSMTRVPSINHYVVGSYDGVIRCLDDSEKGGLLWETSMGAAIYTKPIVVRLETIGDSKKEIMGVIVTSTAGDVVLLNAQDGKMLWRHRIPAEIWSDPVYLAESKTIVFGARDSCLHFVKIPAL